MCNRIHFHQGTITERRMFTFDYIKIRVRNYNEKPGIVLSRYHHRKDSLVFCFRRAGAEAGSTCEFKREINYWFFRFSVHCSLYCWTSICRFCAILNWLNKGYPYPASRYQLMKAVQYKTGDRYITLICLHKEHRHRKNSSVFCFRRAGAEADSASEFEHQFNYSLFCASIH